MFATRLSTRILRSATSSVASSLPAQRRLATFSSHSFNDNKRNHSNEDRQKAQWSRKVLGSLAGLGIFSSVFVGSALAKEHQHEHAIEKVPGEHVHMDSKVMDMGMNIVQDFAPVNRIHQHLCAIHFYDGDIDRQVIAHHYCSHQNEEFRQCVIYDSNAADARLIGLEYIISERLFQQLPEEEKKYWHSHVYEVKSGLLVAPGIPDLIEKQEMKKVVTTYGKAWHTWQVDREDPLPYGPANLMMAFTRDDQIHPHLLQEKDRRAKSSTVDKKASRADIPFERVAEGADQGFHSSKYL